MNKLLLRKAKQQLEGMEEVINDCMECLNGLYASRSLVAYLLWLAETQDINSASPDLTTKILKQVQDDEMRGQNDEMERLFP